MQVGVRPGDDFPVISVVGISSRRGRAAGRKASLDRTVLTGKAQDAIYLRVSQGLSNC